MTARWLRLILFAGAIIFVSAMRIPIWAQIILWPVYGMGLFGMAMGLWQAGDPAGYDRAFPEWSKERSEALLNEIVAFLSENRDILYGPRRLCDITDSQSARDLVFCVSDDPLGQVYAQVRISRAFCYRSSPKRIIDRVWKLAPPALKRARQKYDDEIAKLPTSTAEGYAIGYRVWKVEFSSEAQIVDDNVGPGGLRVITWGREPLFPECGVRLMSVFKSTGWPPMKRLRANEAPECDNINGIYAVNASPNLVIEKDLHSFWLCVGEVALWGKVIHHELGMRAEFAYPLSLTVIPPIRKMRRVLTDDRNIVRTEIVPVKVSRDQLDDVRRKLANAYGVDVDAQVIVPEGCAWCGDTNHHFCLRRPNADVAVVV